MGLFQRQPITDAQPFYRLGLESSKLVVGLGNTGKKYDGTRHNIGFACVDYFAKANDFPAWVEKKDLKCLITTHTIAGTRVVLIKPTTFMNNSGEAVQAVQNYYKLSNNSTIAVHDELALPFGQLRTRMGGSDAGNNGIKSLIKLCGEDFGRIRIGIANEFSDKAEATDFVLGTFTKDESAHLTSLFREVNALLNEIILATGFPSDTRSYLS